MRRRMIIVVAIACAAIVAAGALAWLLGRAQVAYRDRSLRGLVPALVSNLLPGVESVSFETIDVAHKTGMVFDVDSVSLIERGVGSRLYRLEISCSSCDEGELRSVADIVQWLVRYSPGDPQIVNSYAELVAMGPEALDAWSNAMGW
jgi:hypothetical protein